MRKLFIQKAQKVVIKIGTRVLTQASGKLDEEKISSLVRQMAILKQKGLAVTVVTSGAIGAGMGELKYKSRPTDISQLQAVAAVGQIRLMHLYHELFYEKGFQTAQILLSASDFKDETRHKNARNTFKQLLGHGVIPLVNENDTVAVEEIKFGDNDHLSVFVAELVDADLLVLLSVTDGLLTADPSKGEQGERISEVAQIGPEIEELAGEGKSNLGSGGMKTKLRAAKMVTDLNKGVVIADGCRPNVLIDLFEGKDIGTFFVPNKKK